ncbi:MAG: efflux RND transporter periplasmic adaptor subunit [Pseudomonadota bacterium]
MPETEPQGASREEVEAALGLGERRRGWRLLVWLALAVVVAGAAAWLLSRDEEGPVWVTQPAERGDLTVLVTATGAVEPTNLVEVSSELSGIVKSVLVDFNDQVAKGQVLAELDTDKLEAGVESARARVAAAQARVAEAEATVAETELQFERAQRLAARSVVSEHEMDVARAAHARAKAGLAYAQAEVGAATAELRLTETTLSKACICSPIDGVVLSRDVDPGQTVASSLQAPVLFAIAEDLDRMEVQVDVDEADVGQVKEGQSASFTVDAYPDRRFEATVSRLRLGSEVVQGVVTYKAILTADNSEGLLRPGMTATAEIAVQEVSDAVLVPNAALRFVMPEQAPEEEDSRSLLQRIMPHPPRFARPRAPERTGPERMLWVLEEGEPRAAQVTVGATDGERTQIVEGPVGPGDRLVVDMEEAEG